MSKMFIKTVQLSKDYNPTTWNDTDLKDIIENNTVVGYLLSTKTRSAQFDMSINLYLLPPSIMYENSLNTIKISLEELKSAFLQWLEQLTINISSFQFRNPPLDLWLDIRLNWINALSIKIHQKYGTDVSEAMSTAYMTILKLYNKGNIYFGNTHYLEIAIYTAIKKEHHYMRNRLTGGHPDAIHLDATPGEFNSNIENDVTDFHEIITACDWETEEEKRYNEIWEAMKEDMREDFSEREIEQICKGNLHAVNMPLYRRLIKWQKTHDISDYY